MSLMEHMKLSKREVAVVIQDCVEALRDGWMDTEGLFRIAGSAAKIKFLKVSISIFGLLFYEHCEATLVFP